jgi:hypothetical protein
VTTLNPAERWAALRLLESAVKDAAQAAKVEAEVYRQRVGAKALESRFGDVSITRRKPVIRFDPDALLAWAEENAPHMIERTIPAHLQDALKRELIIDGDDVVTADGEVVDFATVQAGVEFLTWRASAETKAEAAAAVAQRLDATITAALPA